LHDDIHTLRVDSRQVSSRSAQEFRNREGTEDKKMRKDKGRRFQILRMKQEKFCMGFLYFLL
jgi:hypothetical protein